MTQSELVSSRGIWLALVQLEMKQILFRQSDANYPPLWEDGAFQRAARWHGNGQGPAQYFADTPDGAWAELLRHEEILEPLSAEEFADRFNRTLWAVEVDLPDQICDMEKRVSGGELIGDELSYNVCQKAAIEAREENYIAIMAPSAALVEEGANGVCVGNGVLNSGPARQGRVFVVFRAMPETICWPCGGTPILNERMISRVRYFTSTKARRLL
ncbi:MAG: hypothetical protein DKT66_09885 [Candidatus Melainabacteria bacterium]|nr:MAG: hypothetical protein DKT66_09885 [Candidatus Melainabacteria bacterium]